MRAVGTRYLSIAAVAVGVPSTAADTQYARSISQLVQPSGLINVLARRMACIAPLLAFVQWRGKVEWWGAFWLPLPIDSYLPSSPAGCALFIITPFFEILGGGKQVVQIRRQRDTEATANITPSVPVCT